MQSFEYNAEAARQFAQNSLELVKALTEIGNKVRHTHTHTQPAFSLSLSLMKKKKKRLTFTVCACVLCSLQAQIHATVKIYFGWATKSKTSRPSSLMLSERLTLNQVSFHHLLFHLHLIRRPSYLLT